MSQCPFFFTLLLFSFVFNTVVESSDESTEMLMTRLLDARSDKIKSSNLRLISICRDDHSLGKDNKKINDHVDNDIVNVKADSNSNKEIKSNNAEEIKSNKNMNVKNKKTNINKHCDNRNNNEKNNKVNNAGEKKKGKETSSWVRCMIVIEKTDSAISKIKKRSINESETSHYPDTHIEGYSDAKSAHATHTSNATSNLRKNAARIHPLPLPNIFKSVIIRDDTNPTVSDFDDFPFPEFRSKLFEAAWRGGECRTNFFQQFFTMIIHKIRVCHTSSIFCILCCRIFLVH